MSFLSLSFFFLVVARVLSLFSGASIREEVVEFVAKETRDENLWWFLSSFYQP